MSDLKLLKPHEAAKILRISYSLLAKMRQKGEGPKFIRLSPKGPIRYSEDDIRTWVEFMKKRMESSILRKKRGLIATVIAIFLLTSCVSSPYAMSCSLIPWDPDNTKRCENKETVCYKSDKGISCFPRGGS